MAAREGGMSDRALQVKYAPCFPGGKGGDGSQLTTGQVGLCPPPPHCCLAGPPAGGRSPEACVQLGLWYTEN
jgi:hypothetical protein